MSFNKFVHWFLGELEIDERVEVEKFLKELKKVVLVESITLIDHAFNEQDQ